ncbi:glycosyltransferase [Litoreibacter janthinus]|uniref:glycosyltransferase n=1 Tax=Litoreibacter janthinus TaxID=670154 RepID=UPI0015876E72|nr:glycosyltransferase [Litoreibacter janthinus]
MSDATAPFYCLARISGGYVVLDREGAVSFKAKLQGKTRWGKPDLRARLALKTPKFRGAAESDLRRLAIARSGRSTLPPLPLTHGIYLNIGHSNLSETTLFGIRKAGLKVATLIHDMIPLDFPQFQRDGTVPQFEKKMRIAAGNSDLIIANSADTSARVRHYFRQWGGKPQSVNALLGVPDLSMPIDRSGLNRAYFVTIGTIEPRKNHALLLDVWDELQAELPTEQMPALHIVGHRGWKNEDVFRRLDELKGSQHVIEHSDMNDEALTELLAGSHGLVFPSFAEGFGLPSIEAAQLGISVICGDLAIHHEILGDYPVYVDLQDRYLWKKTILEQANQRQKDLIHANKAKNPKIPTWSEHFEAVNAAVIKLL